MTVPTTATPAPEATSPAAGTPQEPAAAVPAELDESTLDEHSQKVVDAIRNDFKAERTRRQAAETALEASKPKVAEYDRLAEASKTAEERATEAATAAEARANKLVNRAVTAEVKALASSGFADPEDAAAFLDLSKYATDDGDVDTEAVKTDLAALLVRKPHLGKTPGTRLPAPNPAQGSSADGVSTLSTEEQARALETTGDYKGAGAIKANQLIELRKGVK